jgi:hypothetical protein
MKPLYTKKDFDSAKSQDKLPCECYNCASTFFLKKKRIKDVLNPNTIDKGMFCSLSCNGEYNKKRTIVKCLTCDSEIEKHNCNLIKNKNTFCSNSCSAIYNNKHKTWGSNRSKLEIWLEEQLTILYPNLYIDYNKSNAINAELDIYIPSLNLAFEINGIFHYEPIFGVDKLEKTKINDKNKFKICHEKKISLCVINTSKETYFKPNKSLKYLKIITDIINDNLSLN